MERQSFAFGPFTFDRKRRLLLRQGEPVRLGQRGIALLDALLSAEGRTVSKAELMDIAWPGQSVEESNLSVQIAALRKCLGTRPDGQEWIMTVARVGYQLLDTLPQDNIRSPANVPAASKRAVNPSIAVPPFENLSDDPAQSYFSEGVTEDVRTELARIAGLAVIAWNSVLLHKNRHADPREIGVRLGVTHILIGSVRRSDHRVRINVQLVNCGDGRSLWADRYDRDLTDIFCIQEET